MVLWFCGWGIRHERRVGGTYREIGKPAKRHLWRRKEGEGEGRRTEGEGERGRGERNTSYSNRK